MNMHHPASPIPRFVVRATAIASLGGVLFGYDLGVISGALPQLTETFQLTQNQQETVVSVLFLGGGVGAAVGGTICDLIGRKRTIVMVDMWFIVGAIILFLSVSVEWVILGRVVVGFAVSVSGIADVSYLHEIAPIDWRGSIVSVNEACISLGFLLAYFAGYVIDMVDPQNGWRTMFGLSGVVALVQWLGMLKMPESPVWLDDKGRVEESREALRTIHGDCDTTTYPVVQQQQSQDVHDGVAYTDISLNAGTTTNNSRDSRIQEAKQQQTHSQHSSSSHEMMIQPQTWHGQLKLTLCRYYRQAWIAIFLSVWQQFCGQTPVLNYAPYIFASAGFSSNHSTLGSTLLIGFVKFITTVLVIYKIEYIGRRFLLLGGMMVIASGLLLLTIAFSATGMMQSNNSGDTTTSSDDVGIGAYLALPGVLLVVLGYSASFGPLTWLLTSELFPTDIRGRALGLSTIITYLCASFVTFTFLSWQARFGPSAVFGAYGILTLVGVVFAFVAIPDTGGKNPETIELDLNTMWWWRIWNKACVLLQRTNHPASSSSLDGGVIVMQRPSNFEAELT